MSGTFIVGHGRTGTRSITHMFGQIPGVQALHEPKPELYNEIWDVLRGVRGPWLVDRLRNTRRPQLPHYVEATHWFCWLAQEILEAWPNAKIVWLQRDIKSWAWSAWRKGWYHRLADGRRNWVPYIRPEPKGGWLRNTSRWVKLGYLYERIEQHLHRVEQVTDNGRFRRFSMRDLNNLEKVSGLQDWLELPDNPVKPVKVNKGAGIITLGEMERIGIDLTMFGIHEPDAETLEDITGVADLREMGLEISEHWKPPGPQITPRIEDELNKGRSLVSVCHNA